MRHMIFEAGAFSMLRPFYFFEINQAGHKHGVRWATRQDLKGTSINSKTRFVIANEVKQSRVFVRILGRLPRRFAPRNDVQGIFRGALKAVSEKRQGSDALQISCYAGNT